MATTGHSAPPSDAVSGELPQTAGGAISEAELVADMNRTDPNRLYLTDAQYDTVRVGESYHYRAKMFMPCLGQRCPGRMGLRIADNFNVPLDRAFYLCDQRGCRYHDIENAVYPEDLRGCYVMEAAKRRYYKSDEKRTVDEMRTMI